MERSEDPIVDVVMVVHDAARAVAMTIRGLPTRGIRSIVVVDLESSDNTSQVARDHGAVVLRAKGGHGTGCLRAMEHLGALPVQPDLVVFCDPCGPEDPAQLARLLAPFRHERAELVLAIHGDADAEPPLVDRAMLSLINVLYGHNFRELSPMRAVRYPALVALGMSADGEGWHTEMLVKAVRLGLHIVEVEMPRRSELPPPRRRGRGRQTNARKLLRILRHATAR